MKIKLKNILMISFLAVAGIFGVSSAVINNQVKETPVVEKTDAATTNKPGRIYVSSTYASASLDNLYLYYFHGSTADGAGWPGTKISTFTDIAGNKYGYVDIPNGNATSFIVNNNSGMQTEDITINTSGNNLINTSGNAGSGKYSYTYSSKYKPIENVFVSIFDCIWAKSWGATLSNIHVYFYNVYGSCGNDWPGASLTSVTLNGKSYGYCSLPTNATNMQINAWNGKDGSSDCNKNRVATMSIPLDDSYCYDVNSNNSGWDTYQTGSWSKPTQRYSYSSGASSSTARVYINNTKYDCHNDWKKDGQILAVRAWGGSASKLDGSGVGIVASTYLLSWFDSGGSDGRWYAYADIPTNVSGFQFVRMENDTSTSAIWSYSDVVTSTPSAYNVVYYLKATSTDSCPFVAEPATSTGQGLMTKVLETINTCNSSEYNGYKAYSNLNTNFYATSTSAAKTAKYTTYNDVSSYSADTIFTALYARNASNNPSVNYTNRPVLFNLGAEENISTIVIIVSSSIALLSVTALSILVIRKRKSKEQE